ncbi:MAG: COX15/CtaA family protein [Gammaproteobacteria bacterium]
MTNQWFARIGLLAVLLALCVVVLGAFVRLSDAGLGCPDWPGCYGRIAVPESHVSVAEANRAYPHRPVEPAKAWKEMIHRYFAGTLGLLILTLAILAWRHRRDPGQQVALPIFLVVLVVFQALLGMWTVTLLLKPLVVLGHLLGGMATLSLLWWMYQRHTRAFAVQPAPAAARLRPWALLGIVVLAVQIALGGWTSSNYAALACTEFPTCIGGQWWPHMDFKDAFVLWRGLGLNYEYGVLDSPARAAIHMVHRIGALVTFIYLGTVGIRAWIAARSLQIRAAAGIMLLLLVAQVSLGISNVVFSLPLPVAVAHNGGAALLMLSLITLNHQLRPRTI